MSEWLEPTPWDEAQEQNRFESIIKSAILNGGAPVLDDISERR